MRIPGSLFFLGFLPSVGSGSPSSYCTTLGMIGVACAAPRAGRMLRFGSCGSIKSIPPSCKKARRCCPDSQSIATARASKCRSIGPSKHSISALQSLTKRATPWTSFVVGLKTVSNPRPTSPTRWASQKAIFPNWRPRRSRPDGFKKGGDIMCSLTRKLTRKRVLDEETKRAASFPHLWPSREFARFLIQQSKLAFCLPAVSCFPVYMHGNGKRRAIFGLFRTVENGVENGAENTRRNTSKSPVKSKAKASRGEWPKRWAFLSDSQAAYGPICVALQTLRKHDGSCGVSLETAVLLLQNALRALRRRRGFSSSAAYKAAVGVVGRLCCERLRRLRGSLSCSWQCDCPGVLRRGMPVCGLYGAAQRQYPCLGRRFNTLPQR